MAAESGQQAPATADQIRRLLLSLDNGYDSCLSLLEALGFSFADEPRSTYDWPAETQEAVREFRLAAKHGGFGVFYVEVSPAQMLGTERQVVTRILRSEPHSLFVFTTPEHELWHFVHVRYDQQAEQRRQLRRFVVDLTDAIAGSRLRTTAERLTKLAIAPGESLTVLDLQARCDDAFRISEVSARFLRDFVSVVNELTTVLKTANPELLHTESEALTQAQLLLDRLVFLYFIQRKGWLNGEADYLYQRFRASMDASPDGDSYYRERLLPLFRALSHRSAVRPRLADGTEEALPFLNGGLFELPLSYGTEDPPRDELLAIPNRAFYSVFDGLLERYNFTTSEDTPLDVEVAINPEVIGTIFETFVLTAEKEPDANAPDRRKATGSYYTPRCVVHLICKAVLRRYLAERTGISNDILAQLMDFDPPEQLAASQRAMLNGLITDQEATAVRAAVLAVRACDPAVGSGAFPVGLLQEMVKVVALLDLRIQNDPGVPTRNHRYHLKRQIIEDCLYGVDIQEQAIQICELRLWLSLIVDHELDPSLALPQRVASVEPLPNLTFRMRVGDSLLDQVFGRDWDLGSSTDADLAQAIAELKRAYYESKSPEFKREMESRILLRELELLEQRLGAQQKEVGADLPLFAGAETARHRRKLEEAQHQLARLSDLVTDCRRTRAEIVSLQGRNPWEQARRFDALRKQCRVSFVWALDFAEVFDRRGHGEGNEQPGFDIIVGNPPFVTARSADLRERYRERWPTSCYRKYHMLAPFIELGLTKLLRPGGQLGYIVSNAFATREFGRPLVEHVLTRMELLNVIDCSGLMFPGHGTPTCMLLGYAISRRLPVAVSASGFLLGQPTRQTIACSTRPGMGRLRDEAEESPLWREILAYWEKPEKGGRHVSCDTWSITKTRLHPWTMDTTSGPLKDLLEAACSGMLEDNSKSPVSYSTVTGMDSVFTLQIDVARRLNLGNEVVAFAIGEDLRDWSVFPSQVAIRPYAFDGSLLMLTQLSAQTADYFSRWRSALEDRRGMMFMAGMKAGDPWYRFEYYDASREVDPNRINWAFIATHISACKPPSPLQTNRSINGFSPSDDRHQGNWLLALLNSSSALLWLKQVCYNKGAGGNEERDRFEFSGGKVQDLPVPTRLLDDPALVCRANTLASECSRFGTLIPRLAPQKLFERRGEAYNDWYRDISGYQQPAESLSLDWQSADELVSAYRIARDESDRLRRVMIALQEEMDWLIYGAYGLLPLEHPAVNLSGSDSPMPIDRMQRPYRLRDHGLPVPPEWLVEQRRLWEERLRVIETNEHVARIEQPAYKRRWEEPFGGRELRNACDWWLLEKAEWLLEHHFNGGPIDLETWSAELWRDARVRAAFEAIGQLSQAGAGGSGGGECTSDAFDRYLRKLVDAESVPDKRSVFKKKHEQYRGIKPDAHLPNGVPRERFRSVTGRAGSYVWAGKDLWHGVEGDIWDE